MFFRDFIVKRLTEGSIPDLMARYCINRKTRRERCRECSRICSENAIKFSKNELPRLDKDNCTGCNMCVDVCPGRAFMPGSMKYLRSYQKALVKYPLVIGCHFSGDNANLKFPCINSISKEFLMALFIGYPGKEISFYRGNCESCKYYKKGHEVFLKRCSQAKKFVGSIKKELPQINEIYEYKQNPLEETSLSRRDLFKIFREETGKSGTDIVEDLLNRNKPLPLPEDRKLLIEVLKEKQVYFDEGTPLPFKFWELNEKCNGCKICSNVCPRKAWDKKESKETDEIELRHFPWLCFGCGVCERYCPQNAIKEVSYQGKIFAENVYFTKKVLKKEICSSCKTKYVKTGEIEDNICPTCSRRKSIKQK